ncbi:SDR family NAD(P)-dependent oxidoreductase [Streptomyces virginiae]|uniref:SDR family NAD(P)-dependent oxidoreductase n=1 Tax=Streptomyces virginiae TaxID=1961 RepID=UPI0030DEF8F8
MSARPVTVVTGGSRGIGAATCLRLASDGHDLALGYTRDAAAAEAVAERVRAVGARCVTVRGDVSQECAVERLFDIAGAELGRVTGLVNNAGVTGPLGRLADARTEDLRRVVEVNLLGYLLCCRRAARDMAEADGGAIVNVSSTAATLGSPGEYVHYAATKAAVDALTVGLAKELGPDGVRVDPTPLAENQHEQQQRDGGEAGACERLRHTLIVRRGRRRGHRSRAWGQRRAGWRDRDGQGNPQKAQVRIARERAARPRPLPRSPPA